MSAFTALNVLSFKAFWNVARVGCRALRFAQ